MLNAITVATNKCFAALFPNYVRAKAVNAAFIARLRAVLDAGRPVKILIDGLPVAFTRDDRLYECTTATILSTVGHNIHFPFATREEDEAFLCAIEAGAVYCGPIRLVDVIWD